MNNKELQAARKLLMLDVSEAAELVGGVSARTWQYWEVGRTAVPTDVEDKIQELLAVRVEMMGEVDDRITAGETDIALEFFTNFAEFEEAHPGEDRLTWRLRQSVAALYYTEGHAKLV